MNIYYHTDINAIEDSNYYFKVGEYYRLPVKAVGNFTESNKKPYIKVSDNFSHKVCAEVEYITYKKDEDKKHALVVFNLSIYEPYLFIFNFFIEFSSIDYDDVEKELKKFQLNKFYEADVNFIIECGLIESIVGGLWDNLNKYPYERTSPFTIFEIKKIISNNEIFYDIKDSDCDNFIIETRKVCQDELIQHTLDYYDVEKKINFNGFGSFHFGFIHMYMGTMPEYIGIIGNETIILSEIFESGNFENIIKKIKNNIWTEDGYAIDASYEDKSFSFCKVELPICGWDEDNEVEYDILVRYTTPYENSISTMTNLKELEQFIEWNNAIKKQYTKSIAIAKENNYKFTWK